MLLTRRLTLTSAAALALATALPSSARADEPIPVVATFSILADMVGRVGGEHVAVTSLVPRNGDTHVYQPTPADARAVSEAQVLFVNGLEFEGWMDRLIDASEFSGLRVVTTEGIEPIPFEDEHGHGAHGDDDHDEHGHDEHGHDDHGHEAHADAAHGDKEHGHDDHAHGEHAHDEHAHDDHDHDAQAEDARAEDAHAHDDHGHDDHGHEEHADAAHGDKDHGHDEHAEAAHAHDDHGHDHGEFDPHTWQSLTNAVAYVGAITDALVEADPSNAEAYRSNAAAYVAEIEALDAEIREILAGVPADKRVVVTSHDAFQYFGRDYGLTFLAPQGLSTDAEASAQDIAELIEQIREDGIQALFVESITDPRVLETISRETGVGVGGTLYPGALTELDGPAPTYLELMRTNAKTIAAALSS